jgi:hypothetical protein
MPPHRSDRPFLPGYGIEAVSDDAPLLTWSWAVERLATSHNYWVATSSTDGEPHLAAVWGVWMDDAFVFSTAGRSRKARHLRDNARATVAPADAAEAITVTGRTTTMTDPTAIADLTTVYVEKYGDGFPDPVENPLVVVRPDTVIAVVEATFTTSATRWHF